MSSAYSRHNRQAGVDALRLGGRKVSELLKSARAASIDYTQPAQSESALRVLAVTTDVHDADAIGDQLRGAGFKVRVDLAVTRSELAVRLRGRVYDVIVADFDLGQWTALDVLVLLRELGNDTPVIVVAPIGDPRVIECVRSGATDYVSWQNLSRLTVAVRRGIAERRARLEREDADQLIRKLTLAVDQSPASVIFTNTAGTIEYVNQRFTEVTGYTFDEAVGRTPRMLNSGQNSREMYASLWRTIRDGQVWRGELRNRRKNGDVYWDSVSISPIRDNNGTVTHFLGCQEDITARKNAEQQIRESEHRFRQLAENTQEVFFVASASLREMLYISPAYEQIWGRSCESLYANPQSFIDAIPLRHRDAVFAYVSRLQRGEAVPPIEYEVVRPDGSVRWVLNNAVAIKDASGVVYRMSGSVIDVTDRRNAEIALKESEERFRLLTEASFDGIVIVANGVIKEANQGLADITGYTVEELIGSQAIDIAADESKQLVRGRIAQGIDGVYEFVGLHRSGRKILFEAAAKSHVIDGRPGRITALRDITEKRNLENQFRQAQKMEAVGRLAGGVAHDFNNLLSVILTYSEMLAESLDVTDERREDIEEIQKASKAAASLTRQLLAFSRQQVIEPRVVSLNEVVANADKMLRRLIGEDIELASRLCSADCSTLIDAGQLEQVIMNLAVNARDAMPTGGKLTLETLVVDLDDTYAHSHFPAVAGRFAMLAVTDTGIGMTPETRARIFEPFFTTKEAGKGTGLGLATVYGIVKQNNGFIWVYSEVGAGSTFKLYFPIASAAAPAPATAGSTANLRGTESILLVEDSPAVRTAARAILQRYGYNVIEAATGKAALAIATKRQPAIDLLLTDVVMPEMSGRELAEEFSKLRPDCKVIFMSGYTDDAVVRHGILTAKVAYLQKPFSGEALAGKVRSVLDGTTPVSALK
ncbi:MAG TPA: PAS domain S-box protein [Gemmatimonadaceae bacterium]|nr:PAS domain S-box protein [Gemmatimonadaceae bacterium]